MSWRAVAQGAAAAWLMAAGAGFAEPVSPAPSAEAVATRTLSDERVELEALATAGAADGPQLRRLGEMYSAGSGGRRDARAALRSLEAAAAKGDRYASVLIGDHHYAKITGGSLPADGKVSIRGSIPLKTLRDAARWYEEALRVDDRAEAKARAQIGLTVIQALVAVNQEVAKRRQ